MDSSSPPESGAPPPVPPIPPPQSAAPASADISWKAVMRDVVIVFVLTGIGGFLVGLTASRSGAVERNMAIVGIANLLMGGIGFAIAGCLAVGPRWKHLGIVAVGVWLASVINVILFGFPVIQWIFGIVGVFVMMGVGGAISYIFKRD